MMEFISGLTFKTFIFQGFETKRKILNFGFDRSFDKRILTPGNDIPDFFHPLMEKTAAHLGINYREFKELLLIEYPIGAVMNWHRDAPPFDKIAGISLFSDCSFRFRPYDKIGRTRKSTITLPVRRRSLYLMEQESRSECEHSVTPALTPRYSITLRTLKK